MTVLDVPWDADRDSPEVRAHTVEGLAARIRDMEPPDAFLDTHRRSI